MAEESENPIWANCTDGALIHQLFGYWPTLHDARVRSIDFRQKGSELGMTLDYTDQVAEMDSPLRVRLRFCWTGLRSVELDIAGSDCDGLSFRAEADQITTEFVMAQGISGRVVAADLDVLLMQVDPTPEDDLESIRLTYR